MIRFLMHGVELFGVVYLRFRLIPRLWCVWLVGVNAACLLFITHIEAQLVLAVTGIAVAAQTLIYQWIGFTRILGVAHILWVPMFAWFATRLETIASDPGLANWLLLLFFTNLISIMVDTIDVVRFIRGERMPHYRWKLQDPA
jgi:Na+/phosphate symporter